MRINQIIPESVQIVKDRYTPGAFRLRYTNEFPFTWTLPSLPVRFSKENEWGTFELGITLLRALPDQARAVEVLRGIDDHIRANAEILHADPTKYIPIVQDHEKFSPCIATKVFNLKGDKDGRFQGVAFGSALTVVSNKDGSQVTPTRMNFAELVTKDTMIIATVEPTLIRVENTNASWRCSLRLVGVSLVDS